MRLFRDLPIQRKMFVMTLLICAVVLCVAVVALFTFQVRNFRANFQRDTDTLAVIIANNSTAALAFSDERAATEVVGSLRAKPSVVSATLVLSSGAVFAHFGWPEDRTTLGQFPSTGEDRFVDGQLLVTQPVSLKRERSGTLLLRSNYNRTYSALL